MVACTGRTRTSAPPVPNAPSLTATVLQGSHDVKLAWEPAHGQVDGYLAEVAVEGGAFQKVSPESGKLTRRLYQVPDEVPDLAHLQFRVRTVSASRLSGPGPVAACTLGVRQPKALNAARMATDAGKVVQLSWDPPTDPATTWRLERLGTAAGDAPTLLQEGGAGQERHPHLHEDALPEEGCRHVYRLVFRKYQTDSLARETAFTTPPLAPEAFRAEVADGQVRLSWTNRSQHVQKIQVWRKAGLGPSHQVANLDPGQTSFAEAVAPGFYRYHLEVISEAGVLSHSTEAKAGPLPPGSPLSFKEKTVRMPAARMALPNAQGAWRLLASGHPSQLLRQAEGQWSTKEIAPSQVQPGLRVDTQGEPHTLERCGPGGAVLRHTWHDGSDWRSESAGLASLPDHATFVLLPGAQPAVIWMVEGGNRQTFQVRLRTPKGWVDERLTLAEPGRATSFQAQSDSEGRLLVLVQGPGDRLLTLFRATDGHWQEDKAPFPFAAASQEALQLAPAGGGRFGVLTLAPHEGEQGQTLQYRTVHPETGQWTAPEPVGGIHEKGSSPSLVGPGEATPTWVLVRQEAGILVYQRNAGGSWSASLFPMLPNHPDKRLSFFLGPKGRLQGLFQDTFLSDGQGDYRLFTGVASE